MAERTVPADYFCHFLHNFYKKKNALNFSLKEK